MLNAEDKSFVEAMEKRVAAHFSADQMCDEDLHIERLIAIIKRQELALEKCKSQRDEWIEDHCYEPDNKLQQVMTYEKLVEIQNKELSEILGGG